VAVDYDVQLPSSRATLRAQHCPNVPNWAAVHPVEGHAARTIDFRARAGAASSYSNARGRSGPRSRSLVLVTRHLEEPSRGRPVQREQPRLLMQVERTTRDRSSAWASRSITVAAGFCRGGYATTKKKSRSKALSTNQGDGFGAALSTPSYFCRSTSGVIGRVIWKALRAKREFRRSNRIRS